MYARFRLFFLLFHASFCIFGQNTQIVDNFSDGDFSQNPAWTGDVANFVVNANAELQLMAPDGGVSALFTQGNIPDSCVWDMRIRMDFSPSTSNLLRIVLWADGVDLSTANAYWIEIGESLSDDALRLVRSVAGTKSTLAKGVLGLVGGDSVNIHLNMARDLLGNWTLLAAVKNDPLQLQFNVTDATFMGSSNAYLGFYCLYSATRKDKFFFDDVQANGYVVADMTPPTALSAAILDGTTISVLFSENMDAASVENPANYSLNNGIGSPQSAALDADERTLLLTFGTAFPTGNHVLSLNGAKDLAGNPMQSQTFALQYVSTEAAVEFDILINEIMADPTPPLGLPDAEWVELYNRSDKYIRLNSLTIQDATGAPVALPDYVLPPDGYVVLAAVSKVDTLKTAVNGTVLGIVISTIALNNDGDILTLSDLSGKIIDRVPYSVDWHTVTGKKDGGWSLERINPETPCIGRENWQSCSLSPAPGGTPGQKNASFSEEPDEESPLFRFAVPIDANTLLLRFSEGMDAASENLAYYAISPGLPISSVKLSESDRANLILELASPLQAGVVYTLDIKTAVSDCGGNQLLEDIRVPLGLPEKPGPQDVVINEVLFNPPTGGVRYIEVFNRSNKIFNWSEFNIGNYMAGADFTDVDIEPVTAFRLLLPGTYDVLTAGPDDVVFRHKNIKVEHLLYQPSFPSMNDKKGNVTLFWAKGNEVVTVDSFVYFDTYHNGLFSTGDRDGVALERISSESPTNAASNWTSASPFKTGAPGTPTLPNSQSRPVVSNPGDDLITVPIPRLSPADQDGFEDFLDIQYTLPREGYAATFTIYDADGVPVRRLVRQQLIGTSGNLRWDGEDDDGRLARPGVYILYMEIFAADGTVSHVKKTVAMVRKF